MTLYNQYYLESQSLTLDDFQTINLDHRLNILMDRMGGIARILLQLEPLIKSINPLELTFTFPTPSYSVASQVACLEAYNLH